MDDEGGEESGALEKYRSKRRGRGKGVDGETDGAGGVTECEESESGAVIAEGGSSRERKGRRWRG